MNGNATVVFILSIFLFGGVLTYFLFGGWGGVAVYAVMVAFSSLLSVR